MGKTCSLCNKGKSTLETGGGEVNPLLAFEKGDQYALSHKDCLKYSNVVPSIPTKIVDGRIAQMSNNPFNAVCARSPEWNDPTSPPYAPPVPRSTSSAPSPRP